MGYTAAQAARITGCSASQVRYWTHTGVVAPAADGYAFRDLVALRLVRSLLDTGLPLGRIRSALRYLRESGDDISGLRIVTDGATVTVCHDDGQILDALHRGQLALFVPVDRYAAEVEAETRAFDAERAAFVDHLREAGR